MTDTPKVNPPVISGRVMTLGTTKKLDFQTALLGGPGRNVTASDGNQDPKAVASNALEYEDAFAGKYGLGGLNGNNDAVVLEPPFNPLTLEKLVKHNNCLGPCVNAMVTNIDGTGYEVININAPGKKSGNSAAEKQRKAVESFLAEPWPGVSFTTIRKDLRKDLETLGYGFLEVIRNPAGKIVFLRHVEGKTMRLLQLDAGVSVKRSVNRNGEEQSVTVSLRFRRFVQCIGNKYVFFKEFQADPDLDKNTGKWAPDGTKLPITTRASELIYFVTDKDINTPYGVPRWIAQLPSVLGSRKAEETNLDFFDSGGIPPFMMIVGGGILAQETRDAIENALNSDVADKRRGLVVEAHSSSGSLNDAGNNVTVTVERFGSEQQNDSQYENYDEKCENRVRGSFRLPAIFSGRSDTYNYSTAFVSYMLAEAQVFAPERSSFDEVISMKVIPDILGDNSKVIQLRSLGIVVNDAKEKISAVQLASTSSAITKGEQIQLLNEITGLDIQVASGEEDVLVATPKAPGGGPTGNATGLNTNSELTDASTVQPGDLPNAGPAGNGKTTGGNTKAKPK